MSKYDMLVVLPSMPPERYREAAVAALMPYYSELEMPEYRDYEPADPNSVYWVQVNKERGILPDREALGWSEIADSMNSWTGKVPGDDGYLYVDEAGCGYHLATHNPQGKWDGLGLRLEGPRLLHRPDAAGDPLLAMYEYGEVPQDRDLLAGLPNRCDGGPRGLLDFEALRAAHERLAGERHDAWVAGGDNPTAWPFWFTEDRAENLALARANAVPGYALLRLDGSWIDKREDGYLQNANAYLDALDPDSVVLDVSCHC
ncbi:hypothetical protein ACFVHB_37350 [Kitasatospora sp. NPDC127111]|uniref:hypothetical protein n=1 Tax=Kitasatospora sp. NPDC127111 TaxID=3345363 RepID=UPI0036251A7B